MNKQAGGDQPRNEGLDEITVDFIKVASQVAGALWRGEELRTRYMILGQSVGVIWGLLRSVQYPRDLALIEQLVGINVLLTNHLDSIVLNANSDDPALQKLREVAEQRVTWPTHVRPEDEKFTELKIGKLNVGAKVAAASLASKRKRAPSLATHANRLTSWLIGDLTNWAESVFHVRRNGVLDRSTQEEASQLLLLSGVPKNEHAQFLRILERVERHPFSAGSVTDWGGILADYVLFKGPQRFPELKSLLKDEALWDPKTLMSLKRSRLQKFFHPALKIVVSKSACRSSV
jgi:hypothetical protein